MSSRSASKPGAAPARHPPRLRHLLAWCFVLGLAAQLVSPPAQALRSPGLVRGLVCAVPLEVCLRVVSHAAVNGTEVIRDRPLIPAIGPLSLLPGQPIDVTGDGRDDLLVTLSVPLTLLPPGYDANRPTLKVVKLPGAPAQLPVKLEVVTDGGSGGKLSFGYDARNASAPQSFVARINLSDRDGLADTEQAQVDLAITAGNSSAVALVTESFAAGSGLAESQRLQREITQIGFVAVAALGTSVPASASVDFTSSPGMQHILLGRSQVTTAEVLLESPNQDPRISGRIDRLPATVELTIVDEDTDDNGSGDHLSFDYAGSEPISEARLKFELLARDAGGAHRRTLGVTAHDLPAVAHFEYDSLASALALDTSARVRSVTVTGEDSLPFFERAKAFRLQLDDLPRTLSASFGGGRVTLDAYTARDRLVRDALAMLEFRGQEQLDAGIELPDCGMASCDDGYDLLRDSTRNGAVREDLPERYLLAARVHKLRQADLVTAPDTDLLIDTAPDLGPPGSACGEFPPPDCDARTESYRPFEALLKSERVDDDPQTGPVTSLRAQLATLWPQTRFTQSRSGRDTPDDASDDTGTITYANGAVSGAGTDIEVTADNLPGPTGSNGHSADRLQVLLDGVPNSLVFSYAGDGFPLKLRSTGGSGLRRLDVLLASAGMLEEDRLPVYEAVDYPFTPGRGDDDTPRNLDGVRIRDFADRYVIHARMAWLRNLTVDRASAGEADTACVAGDELCVAMEVGNTGNHPRLRFDSQTYVEDSFGSLTLPGVATVFATLDAIPANLLLRQFKGADDEIRLAYSASAAVGVLGESSRKGFELLQTTNYHNPAPDPILPNKHTEVSFAPMPQTVSLCSSGDTAICSEGVFGSRSDADTGSLGFVSVPRSRFRYTDQPNTQAQVFTVADLTADVFRFQADATGAGYLAYDTGWDGSGPAPAAARIGHSVIRQVNGTRDITDFTFAEGFAADSRMLAWSSDTVLFAADTTDITSLVDRTGRVGCPSGTSLVLHRVGPGGIDLTLDLSNELCE